MKREGKVISAPVRDVDCLKLVPDAEQAKFFALGAQFVIIQELCQQDLRFKVHNAEKSCRCLHETGAAQW